jgi:hypothetical protein
MDRNEKWGNPNELHKLVIEMHSANGPVIKRQIQRTQDINNNNNKKWDYGRRADAMKAMKMEK